METRENYLLSTIVLVGFYNDSTPKKCWINDSIYHLIYWIPIFWII